jgi:hypothetical protein
MSAMRSFSQIPVRVKYFLAVDSYIPLEDEGVADPGDAGVNFQDGFQEIVVEGSITLDYVGFSSGDLLKDLGQQFTMVDINNNHIATYRKVQRVNGPASEGVGPALSPADGPFGTFFVKVWSADGQGVYVVRTG